MLPQSARSSYGMLDRTARCLLRAGSLLPLLGLLLLMLSLSTSVLTPSSVLLRFLKLLISCL